MTGPQTKAHGEAQVISSYTAKHKYAMFATNLTAVVVPHHFLTTHHHATNTLYLTDLLFMNTLCGGASLDLRLL
jgi:hypothetical protein